MRISKNGHLTPARIIVGVKYCFRYNARNRQMRNEDGEPINMENMPRPHRRRREKKLMPIDEVNEKFPMMKYKTWVASRADEGLPTRGGVSAPPSRANSIRDADGVGPELPLKERISTDDRPTTSATATGNKETEITTVEATAISNTQSEKTETTEAQRPQHVSKESTSSTVGVVARTSKDADRDRDPETTVAQKHMSQVSHDEDYDDDEHIDAALPPECMGTAGDTCAICIDTLEDDDDVRGLTCGHAFHAACIDPWLTTRRACCPLCKADYFTPKPRPQAEHGPIDLTNVTLPGDSRRNHRVILPSRPRHAFFGFGRSDNRTTTYYASSRRRTTGGPRPRDDSGHSFGRSRTRNNTEPPAVSPAAMSEGWAGGVVAGFRAAFPRLGASRGQNNQAPTEPAAAGANPTATPSQLEAGTRFA